jgi:cell division protease FtsH
MSKRAFLDDIAMSLGGYVAEKEVFGDLTTGPSNDLQVATGMARDMVTKYGMSDAVGPVVFADGEESVFLGRELHHETRPSEATSAKIDAEVSRFLHNAHEAAKRIIVARRKVLDAIAARLIEKETIEQEEFDALMKEFDLKPLAI